MNLRVMVVMIVIGLCGCKRDSGAPAAADYLDDSITAVQPLGWLGGAAHAATRSVKVPERSTKEPAHVTGGMVLTTVTDGGPLASGGMQRGDVIVRIGERWLPNKEDPGLDLMRAIEAEVSAAVESIDVGVLQHGKYVALAVKNDRKPMELGLPGPSERLGEMARTGLSHLAGEVDQLEKIEDRNDRLATASMAGLALAAGRATATDSPWFAAMSTCREVVSATITDEAAILTPWSTALATMFLAELAGPLDLGGDGNAVFMSAAPGGMPKLPEGFSMEGVPPGGVVTHSFVVEGDGSGGLPEGMDMSEMMKGGGGVMIMGDPSMMPGQPPSATAATEDMPDDPAWTIEELKAIAGPDVADRLKDLSAAVKRLVALQDDRGAWDADREDMGYSERSIATNQALCALGMAQHAGVPVAGSVLKQALSFVRSTTNEGHVHSVATAGFDRRHEAGRSSGAAAALHALRCDANDEFMSELNKYSDDHAQDLPSASGIAPLHILNTAIAARQRGRDAWAMFFEEFRPVLVAQQQSDGSFAALPGESAQKKLGVSFLDGAVARDALWSLIAALQDDHMPVLLANTPHPLQPTITSDGKLVAGGAGPTMFSGAPMNPEDAKKMLESMGVDMSKLIEEAMKQHGQNPEE